MISMIFDAWLLIDSEEEMVFNILLFSIFLLGLFFVVFSIEVRKEERNSAGLIHVLEKSESSRIAAEKLKNEVLLLIDDLPEGILVVNKDNKIVVINRKAEIFLGVNRARVFNKTLANIERISTVKKVVIPLLINYEGAAFGFGKARPRQEIEAKKNLILELGIVPLLLGKNNIAKLIVMHDITKIKSAETTKSQLLSVVAHQLKTPLSATRLSLEMLLKNDFGKINSEQKNILEKTYKNNESLIYLVEELLKEARVDGDGPKDNRSFINLEELIYPVIDFYKDEMKRRKIDFKFHKSERRMPDVFADPEKIEMVIQNLFDNAVKYTRTRGKIEISVVPTQKEIEFKIKDNGIGIPESQKEKIFARFSRAVNVVRSEPTGSGLGLAIAKDIVEKNHGKIWFESKENQGSTFFFCLPIAKEGML